MMHTEEYVEHVMLPRRPMRRQDGGWPAYAAAIAHFRHTVMRHCCLGLCFFVFWNTHHCFYSVQRRSFVVNRFTERDWLRNASVNIVFWIVFFRNLNYVFYFQRFYGKRFNLVQWLMIFVQLFQKQHRKQLKMARFLSLAFVSDRVWPTTKIATEQKQFELQQSSQSTCVNRDI